MIKIIHITFISTSFISFVLRIGLSQFKPEILKTKILNIIPHIIDTGLLLSGIGLVLQGNWLEGEFGWIASKITLLFCYIILGVIAMHYFGVKRWLAFCGAVSCYILIFIIAVTKNGFI